MPYVIALLQAPPALLDSLGFMPAMAFIAVVVAFGLVSLFVSRYKRCPANRILVISGRVSGGESARCISGGGTFVWPVIQEAAYLDLEPIQIDIPLRDALSFENIRVAVPSVFTVAVGTESEVRQNAAIRLLGLGHEQIKAQARDIIFGQLRQVIASMRIEEINRDRDGFLHRVQASLEPELKKIGLVLINVNITDLKDESGYIEAIGRKAASMAVQQARGDVAEQEKLGEIRVAEANREKSVQVANAEKDREIGLAAAMREKSVSIANLEKEQQVGQQSAAFEQEIAVKNAEQLKRVAVAEANAKAVAGEADSQARIVATQAQLKVKQADAFRLAETASREAEAAVSEAQHKAQARAALAQAERIEAERRAELEAPAKAEKARMIVEAEADAERVRLRAQADADAIRMKLQAEADGQYQILSKRSEAIGEMVREAGGAKEAFQLMLVEQIPQLAETAAKAISNIKFDKVVVWEGGNATTNGVGQGATANFVQSLARSVPPIMHVLKEVAGVELPSYLGTMTPDAAVPPQVATPASAVAEVKQEELKS
ncbi:MAG TPA: SPFH domain-containing protein [Gemmatimonadaceae bacterium]|nr:SPFH domain-containing protein [Gemmatimonadaceae bacterium]